MEVPGRFEADFRLEKKPDGFAATLTTLVFVSVVGSVLIFALILASPVSGLTLFEFGPAETLELVSIRSFLFTL